MNLLHTLLLGGVAAALIMLLVYAVQRRTGNAGIVDAAWAATLGLLAVLYAARLDGNADRRMLAAAFALLWSGRLAIHLLLRLAHEPEDGRYRALRERYGDRIQTFFFLFFQAQALIAVVLSLSFAAAMTNPEPALGFWDAAAAMLFLVSLGGEALADAQLARFRARPENRGRTCRIGLWRFSRHPNYFFEWLHWWGYAALAAGSPYGWTAWIAPALMYVLIVRVTGIPPTEARALETRGEDYRRYQQTTSAFWPWFPRKELP